MERDTHADRQTTRSITMSGTSCVKAVCPLAVSPQSEVKRRQLPPQNINAFSIHHTHISIYIYMYVESLVERERERDSSEKQKKERKQLQVCSSSQYVTQECIAMHVCIEIYIGVGRVSLCCARRCCR